MESQHDLETKQLPLQRELYLSPGICPAYFDNETITISNEKPRTLGAGLSRDAHGEEFISM